MITSLLCGLLLFGLPAARTEEKVVWRHDASGTTTGVVRRALEGFRSAPAP